MKTFTAPSFFTFHYANAYESEDGGRIHMDMSMYRDPEIVNQLALKPLGTYPGEQREGFILHSSQFSHCIHWCWLH